MTLLTEDGFRQFVLEDAESVKLTDASLEARVGAALDAARLQSAATTRHLTLRTNGDGTRTIDVGYVVATPLWKPSYRVVLPADGGDKARVQGWAVLENQSATDWKGVDLTLHAGNPVTFHQAIYTAYYADRPEVPVEVLGRILPGTDERAIAMNAPAMRFSPQRGGLMKEQFGTANAATSTTAAGIGMEAPAPAAAALAEMAPPSTETAATETPIDTVFHIATPVDLARGHTANVPILDRQMPAEQVDWLEADSTRPVAALRLTNDGTASLPAGALTLYTSDPAKGAAFAGDARLGGLPAGETRLLGYAEDLRTTVMRSESSAPRQILQLTIANGVMHRRTRLRSICTVTLTAPAKEDRKVLVDFAKTPAAKFSVEGGTQGEEETASTWRVLVSLKAGETRRLTAYIDHDTASEDALLDDGELNSTLVTLVLSDGNLSPDAQDKLRALFALRDTVAAKEAALARLNDEKTSIDGDEERIRSNLQVVAGPGDLHGKLLASLDADETRLATLRNEIAAAQQDQHSARKALADAVRGLSL